MFVDVCICPMWFRLHFSSLLLDLPFAMTARWRKLKKVSVTYLLCQQFQRVAGETEIYGACGCAVYARCRSMWEAEHFHFTKAPLILECWFFLVSTGGQVSHIQGKRKLFFREFTDVCDGIFPVNSIIFLLYLQFICLCWWKLPHLVVKLFGFPRVTCLFLILWLESFGLLTTTMVKASEPKWKNLSGNYWVIL